LANTLLVIKMREELRGAARLIRRISLNLEQSQKVLALVLGKAGCPTCYSGLNIAFESAVNPAPTVMTVEKGGQSVSIAG